MTLAELLPQFSQDLEHPPITPDDDTFHLIFITQGNGILQLNERQCVFIAPTIFCLNSRESASLSDAHALTLSRLYFPAHTINEALDSKAVYETPQLSPIAHMDRDTTLSAFLFRDHRYWGQITPGPATAQRIEALFQAVIQEQAQQRDQFWPCRTRSFFLELLCLLFRSITSSQATSQFMLEENCPQELHPILLYLSTHYAEKITLAGLAKQFHTNRDKLRQLFSKATGVPPITYLIKLRLHIASLLLRDTELPVSEIIERIGVQDLSHFSRIFVKYMGCSPSEYRKQYLWY